MGDPPSVLIVDDEVTFCRILDAKLRRSGFSVTVAHTGASALETVADRYYDAVLLDLHLPDASGLDLVGPMRNAGSGAPLILMTAYEEEELRSRALSLGVAEVLYKPFDLDRLVAMIRLLIRVSAATQPLTALAPVGQSIVIEVRIPGSQEYHGRVIEKRRDTFTVASQAAPGALVGASVRIRMPGEDGLYYFNSSVVAQTPEQGVLTLAKPTVIFRRQRRRHARAPLDREVAVRVAPADGGRTPGGKPIRAPDSVAPSSLDAHARDVSLGGMALDSARSLAAGSTVELSWDMDPLGAGPPAAATAVVVDCVPEPSGDGNGMNRISVRFTQLPSETREQIEAHVESLVRL